MNFLFRHQAHAHLHRCAHLTAHGNFSRTLAEGSRAQVAVSVWTVRDQNTVHTRQEPTNTIKFLSLLDRYREQVNKINDNKDSLNELAFSSQRSWIKSHSVQTGQLTLSLTVINRIKRSALTGSCLLHEKEL